MTTSSCRRLAGLFAILVFLCLAAAGCGADDESTASDAPAASPEATDTSVAELASRPCPLAEPGAEAQMAMPGCRLIASDTGSDPDPTGFWGFVACQADSRASQVNGGGDPQITAEGEEQGDDAFRRTTVYDGDDPFGWGERCELGRNDHKIGPTAFYREGDRRVTYISIRLPDNFDPEVETWQNVLQMKEAQPYDSAGGGAPILYMGVHSGRWGIESANGEYARFPASGGVWTRFAFDVVYSQDPAKGRLQVSADLDADGDFDDRGERTPSIEAATLIAETDGPMGGSDGLAAGESIPSHLRAGIYHDPAIPCPRPSGCSVEVDNVQVLAP